MIDHPVFGQMTRDRFGSWVSQVWFDPIGQLVQLRVDGPIDAVPPWAGPCFLELVARFAELEPEAWAKMHERYTWDDPPAGCPRPEKAEAMGRLLVMDDIHLTGPGNLALGYGFHEGVGWDDLMFTVELENWIVLNSSADD